MERQEKCEQWSRFDCNDSSYCQKAGRLWRRCPCKVGADGDGWWQNRRTGTLRASLLGHENHSSKWKDKGTQCNNRRLGRVEPVRHRGQGQK